MQFHQEIVQISKQSLTLLLSQLWKALWQSRWHACPLSNDMRVQIIQWHASPNCPMINCDLRTRQDWLGRSQQGERAQFFEKQQTRWHWPCSIFFPVYHIHLCWKSVAYPLLLWKNYNWKTKLLYITSNPQFLWDQKHEMVLAHVMVSVWVLACVMV